jgi:hypothetical protein
MQWEGVHCASHGSACTVRAGRPSKLARKMCLINPTMSAVFDSPDATAPAE